MEGPPDEEEQTSDNDNDNNDDSNNDRHRQEQASSSLESSSAAFKAYVRSIANRKKKGGDGGAGNNLDRVVGRTRNDGGHLTRNISTMGKAGDQRKDLLAALEHVAVVGNKCRHSDFQMKEWNKKKDINIGAEAMEHGNDIDDTRSSTIPHKTIHAQDARQYYGCCSFTDSGGEQQQHQKRQGGRAAPPGGMMPWSKRRRLLGEDCDDDDDGDSAWHLECSDDYYHPIHFCNDRLSEYPPDGDDPLGGVPSPNGTSVIASRKGNIMSSADGKADENCRTIEPCDANRTLLLRCWERAVHASSSVIHVTKQQQQQLAAHANSIDQNQELADNEVLANHSDADAQLMREAAELELQQRQEAMGDDEPATGDTDKWQQPQPQPQHSREDVEGECQRLKIQLSWTSPFLCPTCRVEFDTRDHLKDHFFGVGENPTRGGCCSHEKILTERRMLLSRALQSSVRRQVHELVRAVTASSERDDSDSSDVGDVDCSPARDWRFVMQTLTNQVQERRRRQREGDENELEDDRDYDNFFITPQLLQTVTRRLVERYGKVPR